MKAVKLLLTLAALTTVVAGKRRRLGDSNEDDDGPDIECNYANINNKTLLAQYGWENGCDFVKADETECEPNSAFNF